MCNHCDMPDPDDYADFSKLDAFTQGAITAAFFTANPLPYSGEYQLDVSETWHKLLPRERQLFGDRCRDFQARFSKLLDVATDRTGNDLEHAGRDYHYSSAGHGCGYWDGDWQADGFDYGRLLHEATRHCRLPEVHAFLDCEQYRESGEGCRDCEGCEAGPDYALE